jgi:hypothetical protein
MGEKGFDNTDYAVSTPKKNPSFSSENSQKKYLETHFFPTFFDDGWKPIEGETKEKRIKCDTDRSKIDYYGEKNGVPTYVEVKNEHIRQKSFIQIARYNCECVYTHPDFNFNLYVICTQKIRPHIEKALEKQGVIILETTDILPSKKELGEVSDWM